MSLANDPTTAIRDATQRIEAGADRDPPRHPRPPGTRVRGGAHRRRGGARADAAGHQPPDRRGQDRRRRTDRGRPAGPGAGDPRRHGRAADRGEVGPAVRQHEAWADACLRPRHPHHHAARRRGGAEGTRAAACRHGEAGVPAGRGRRRRHARDDRRRRDGRPEDRSRAGVPQSSGHAGGHASASCMARAWRPRTVSTSWCAASPAMPRIRIPRSIRIVAAAMLVAQLQTVVSREVQSDACRRW